MATPRTGLITALVTGLITALVTGLITVLAGCTPSFDFDSVCDPANNRLDACRFDGGVDAESAPPTPDECVDADVPCNGIDDDCDDAIDETSPPAGFTCEPPGTVAVDDGRQTLEITRYLLLHTREVSRADWDTLRQTTGSDLPPLNCPAGGCCQASCPAVEISWYDALVYANALTARHNEANPTDRLERCYTCPEDAEGALAADFATCVEAGDIRFVGVDCTGFRLPTEAEWLLAAARRYGDRVGQAPLDEIGRFRGVGDCVPGATDRPITALHEVDGVRDLLGNVAEWVFDGHGASVGGVDEGPGVDPIGVTRANSGVELPRVVRGASACSTPDTARDALDWRRARDVFYVNGDLGLRLVRSTGGAVRPR